MSFPGVPLGGLNGQNAGLSEQQLQEQKMIRYMTAAMESCAGKSVMAGVGGFGLGGMFGMFMASMRYDTPMTPQGQEMLNLSTRQQIARGFKDMGKSSWSSAKNFGMIGALFSGTECTIEALRAKNDIYNGVAGGCITGGALAYKAGPQAAALGCAGFAAFSTAIEFYLRMPADEGSRKVI
ncbi:putative mitochondrial import inner membrane translocase subunit [Viridothelium virens]|uniref:Mitochondrial import inner membrane translocase subunit TIM22 n=1 Tax=Viridothelium virens TaxID=1048519 RepID=A0A6A6GY34_VIRVR|nr:putative mitochondrial import inner membrane translocase subunit [Viridothelium virens]